MPIVPLPQFEADLKQQEEDRKAYEALKTPKTVVVRFGSMKLIGEFAYDLNITPGCGSKMVVRTFRGLEMGEMLTSTCPNSGCSKSVSRQDMLKYIENSGGRDYPFFTEGRVARIATAEDIDAQAKIEQSKHELRNIARAVADRFGITNAKIVEVEPILGGERLTVYYLSEERPDFRELAPALQREFHARVDFKLVGARDEARLTADYEKCGQYCCCKNFLKVLKPISMKAAKTQKATLEPLKISGRCGRLMCCLRYEEQTYDDLKARLPKKRSRVGTAEGDGTVIDGQILTQLVLIDLDEPDETGKPRQVAVAVEELQPPKSLKPPPPRPAPVFEPRGPRPMDRGPKPSGPPPAPGETRPPQRDRGPGGPPRGGPGGNAPRPNQGPSQQTPGQVPGPGSPPRDGRRPDPRRGNDRGPRDQGPPTQGSQPPQGGPPQGPRSFNGPNRGKRGRGPGGGGGGGGGPPQPRNDRPSPPPDAPPTA